MGDRTAAERAMKAFKDAFRGGGGVWTPETSATDRAGLAKLALGALRSDPGLLFDLAVEAEALEHVGWSGCTEDSDCVDGHEWFFRFEDGTSDLDSEHPIEPVYRRAEPSGEGE